MISGVVVEGSRWSGAASFQPVSNPWACKYLSLKEIHLLSGNDFGPIDNGRDHPARCHGSLYPIIALTGAPTAISLSAEP